MHHKYTDTNADPHNASRGFWYSHIGWLWLPTHPDVKEARKIIDMSDLAHDPIVRFQSKLYYTIDKQNATTLRLHKCVICLYIAIYFQVLLGTRHFGRFLTSNSCFLALLPGDDADPAYRRKFCSLCSPFSHNIFGKQLCSSLGRQAL